MNRTQWLRDRQKAIGATDIASIAGVGFQDAAAVYAEKVAPEVIDREPSLLMLMGLATEEMNAGAFSGKTGMELFKAGRVVSPVCPFVSASLDYQGANTGEPVDTKYVGPFFGDRWGDEFSDHVPDGYVVQVTWQIQAIRDMGTLVDNGHISALSGSGDHRAYYIPFDARLASMLVELGAEFWQRVVDRSGVEGWSHPLQAEVVNRIESLRPDVSVELDEVALSHALAYQEDKKRAKNAEMDADAHRAELLKALAGAGEGILPDGSRVKQKIVSRKSYTVEATSYVDFRISPPKKVKAKNG